MRVHNKLKALFEELKPLVCEICKEPFGTKNDYVAHMKIHPSENDEGEMVDEKLKEIWKHLLVFFPLILEYKNWEPYQNTG